MALRTPGNATLNNMQLLPSALPNPILVCIEKPMVEGVRPVIWQGHGLESVLLKNTHLISNSARLSETVFLLPGNANMQLVREFLQGIRETGLHCNAHRIDGTVDDMPIF